MRIAIDAMGGEKSPGVVLQGTQVLKHEVELILVGVEAVIKKTAEDLNISLDGLEIRHASQVIEMDDPPSAAAKKKADSSIRVGLQLLKDGAAQAFVSAGSTGAIMATAKLVLGTIPGVKRPAIAQLIPTLIAPSVLLDVGATVDCRPKYLYQFGLMGNIYAKHFLNIEQPRIGLLNIGSEESKGNQLVKKTYRLFANSPLKFAGNVEANDVFRGDIDVVVCDGFIGNVFLKLSEGLLAMIRHNVFNGSNGTFMGKISQIITKRVLTKFNESFDPDRYGGAPLLGINGSCVVCHGNSSARAIENGIRTAMHLAKNEIIETIRSELG
ncbi:MAG: hypothetical protein A2161_11535 [Candidatus Schekmanbacteria bacterium RBG_13_48_7]|uniref:Phosphate acyltransferase n=1 Tax=Candidatus Schekmanbacteria bacterium RBG_13_48_7 TaxID=1817878 RepID=A0A1F7RWP2_9BACT|nr:MAG: hypothetical protein A2161_11535 [Candidatus Schekmanbacteria bacterium RBG_13_48_7]